LNPVLDGFCGLGFVQELLDPIEEVFGLALADQVIDRAVFPRQSSCAALQMLSTAYRATAVGQ
jgi:hypothetical protein